MFHKKYTRGVLWLILAVLIPVSLTLSSSSRTFAAPPTRPAQVSDDGASVLMPGSNAGISSSSSAIYEELDIFTNYYSWTHSASKKSDDVWAQFIFGLQGPFSSMSDGVSMTYNSYTLVDVNGDGLTDMFYRWGYPYEKWDQEYKMAYWKNTGEGFQLKYKCVVVISSNGYSWQGWYGDCAAQ